MSESRTRKRDITIARINTSQSLVFLESKETQKQRVIDTEIK